MLTLSETSECQATLVPGAGAWCRTTTHFPSVLPGPEVVKNSWARSMAVNVRARERPMSRGTARGPWGFASETVNVASECHATTVPALGDCATTSRHVPLELPGPLVTKNRASRCMTENTCARLSPMSDGMCRLA